MSTKQEGGYLLFFFFFWKTYVLWGSKMEMEMELEQ